MKLFWHRDAPSPPADSHRSTPEPRFPVALSLAAAGKAAVSAAVRATVFALLLSAPFAARAVPCVPVSQDLLVVADPGAAVIRPQECSNAKQNPPDFSWPYLGTGPYTVTLAFPDGHTVQATAANNWLNWNGALPAGDYSWTVTRAGLTSQPRRFTVRADAVSFVVPDMTTVINQLIAKPHPRGLPDDTTLFTMGGQRLSALATLRNQVN